MPMRSSSLLRLIAVNLAFLLGGIGGAAAQTPTAKPLTKLLVAHEGYSTDAPIYIAQERGYFREQGLDVELQRFASTADQIAALGTGHLAVGVGGVNAALFNAVAGDVPIRIVADKFHAAVGYMGIGWVIRTDLLESGAVKTPKDLKGLRLPRGQRATANETELVTILREGGLKLSDVISTDLPYGNLVPALANKSIDGGFAISPISDVIVSRDLAKMWRPSGSIIPDHMVAVILYGPDFIAKQPEAAKGWMIAYVKGIRDYIAAFKDGNPPDDVVAAMVKYGSNKDPAMVRKTALAPINPDGFPYLESLRRDLDYFVDVGYVKNPPALEKVVDRSFADHALSVLGKYQQ
jgi:ABC-type nitrate/sulfonate/bicarbonate transport system substrate-binding protein